MTLDPHQCFTFDAIELLPFAGLDEARQHEVWCMRTHPDIARWMGSGGDIPLASHLAYMARQHAQTCDFNYLGRDAAGTLGVVSLHRLDARNGLAWLGIYRNPFRDEPGLGHRLLQAISQLAFGRLSLHTLKLEVVADNLTAIAAYRRFGFAEEGRWREAILRDDRRYDLLLMGLLAREWKRQ
ncbi:UDP-4-amino-4,6-dideoxy-N-acetyl-beta-L-altrosamine N-acetyltransferase [Chitiniphilus purpureus]|uniref:UDP-4-amino-4, 6-dideoxy-N-acetyl-beta-L-altrosamine N-acetyltransferase n=1 Tax=Chitiniphilus purpureus TaxID=2981137 RepID=A0ABY6DMH5_9NEIS|nr:UDP-4-amino-4,6-dideoxy-N-acetyl-beta-L-altrosamine N-acetyltransferase [Chitiniphilus sp. CD1]UXY15552.1 UDP-4-amino-4,6-dideoxy-N-acetyl-beta-L-altrosamine N-acetyltransferase [Chitiniphilus sp. CD1]